MKLALFDLDKTLIAGDSDSLWTEFLVEEGILGPDARETSERFNRDYEAGRLDLSHFLQFQLHPLSEHSPEKLEVWRKRFVEKKIRPILLEKAQALIEEHRVRGHTLLILTATNRFITEPIARLFGVADLLATEVEMSNGRYTGRMTGVPCFREGKIVRLEDWLGGKRIHDQEASWFYSDSQNDIPLLEKVKYPFAVDPDDVLAEHARKNGWPVVSLR